MSRIGADVKFQDGTSRLGDTPLATLEEVARLGLEGILVRTLDEAFPELAADDIAAFHRRSEELGLFVQVGIGKVNPYMTAELPRVRRLGDGSYLAGMARMIRICAGYGWTELWTAVGGLKFSYPAPYCFDRFRTDVSWSAQLEATSDFLAKLVPTLRAEGVRLDIETHEELTTYELLRLVEAHGEDVIGVCLDPANIPVRGESALAGSLRVARLTRLTHLRDFVLLPSETGITRHLMPIGEGQLDWPALIGPLLEGRDLDLCIEGLSGSRAPLVLQPHAPYWRPSHPDYDEAEIAEIEAMAAAAAGPWVDLPETPTPEYRDFLTRSMQALRGFIDATAATAPAQG